MSKKHFEALAQALANQRPIPWPQAGLHAYQTWSSCCAAVAYVCQCSNPKFDYGHFMQACKEWPVKDVDLVAEMAENKA